MPSLSIVIPTFNSSRTIERCLESISMQTFEDFEVLIQDGCSKDETMDRIAEFQISHPELRIVPQRTSDTGVYDAMNKAVSRATGEWVYFLGSDDELYEPDSLATAMRSAHDSSSDILYGNVMVVRTVNGQDEQFVYDGSFDLKKLLNRNICHQAIFYKKSTLQNAGGYNTRYPVMADWDINLRCWSTTKFSYIEMIVAKFYLGGLSNNGTYDKNFFDEMAQNAMQYFGLSIFSPLLNQWGFRGANKIVEMQQSKGPLYAVAGGVLRRLQRLVTRGTPAQESKF